MPGEGHSIRNCRIDLAQWVAPPGTLAWTNISGAANSIALAGGDRPTGEAYAFDEDVAGVTVGKRASRTMTIRILYRETLEAGQTKTIYETVREFFEEGNLTPVVVRYAPLGWVTGNKVFTTTPAWITSLSEPGGDATSADPIMLEFVVAYSTVAETTVPVTP